MKINFKCFYAVKNISILRKIDENINEDVYIGGPKLGSLPIEEYDNYGSNGKYENIAGCLIAFACFKSVELGKNSYEGYLTFESKTALIDFYRNKYGATLTMGQRMFIDPHIGKKLVKDYLNLEI